MDCVWFPTPQRPPALEATGDAAGCPQDLSGRASKPGPEPFKVGALNRRDIMGGHVNSPLTNLVAWGSAFLVTALDLFLLVAMQRGA